MSEIKSPILLDETGKEMLAALKHIAEREDGKSFANAGYHNSRFRGANLGTAYAADQSAAIKAGTFDDLFVGDYWEIGGVRYRIAGFNLWLNTGDVQLTTNHAVIVPDTNLYTAQMNTTNTTDGAYYQGRKVVPDIHLRQQQCRNRAKELESIQSAGQHISATA